MIKKIKLPSLVACMLFQATSFPAASAAEFDPESSKFSKMETIKTWVAVKHQQDPILMKRIQNLVAQSDSNNPGSSKFRNHVINDEGITVSYGRTFSTIEAIELPFLQFVKQISLKDKKPLTLEIAAARGLVSWKVPYAFKSGGTHYINDLSHTMINIDLEKTLDMCLQRTTLKNNTIKLPGDCFEILEKKPELKGKVSAIYVQNLEHYFNPIQHQRFLNLIGELLKEDGQAFLCAHSFQFGTDKNHPLYKLYMEQKSKNDLYPGFSQVLRKTRMVKGTLRETHPPETFSAICPADDTPFKHEILEDKIENAITQHGHSIETEITTFRVTSNTFSPSIYRNVIGRHSALEVVDAFFINFLGARQEKWKEDIEHCGAIIKKTK